MWLLQYVCGASADPTCTSFIVLKMCGIHYVGGGFTAVFVGDKAVIVAVRQILLVGALCNVIAGWVCLI